MKRFIALSFFIWFISNTILAQNFISTSKIWSFVSIGSESDPNIDKGKGSYFNFTGDTVINNVNYSVLSEYTDYSLNTKKTQYLLQERNDSVFLFDSNLESELIYDFNLVAGDSFIVDEYNKMFVDSVVTKSFGNTARKHWYFSYKDIDYQTVWVEGIGQMGYLLRSSEMFLVGGYSNLLCYTENNNLDFLNPLYKTCELATSTNKETISSEKLIEMRYFGNGELEINSTTNGILSLYDTKGSLIEEIMLDHSNKQVCLPSSYTQVIFRFRNNGGQTQTGKLMLY